MGRVKYWGSYPLAHEKGIHFRMTQGVRGSDWRTRLAYRWDLIRLEFSLFMASVIGMFLRLDMWFKSAPAEELAFGERNN